MQKYSHLPQLEVGILFSPEICFRLNGIFTCRTTGKKYTGAYNIRQTEDGYLLSQADHREPVSLPLTFEPEDDTTSDFDLTDVVIGIQFHWERKENQKFKGKLKIIDEQKHLTAINILSLEDYLLSVISSEMRATSSAEFLKAHAVISRSWLLAQIDKAKTVRGTYSSCRVDQEEYIRWYDREDHAHFDVCADDHCQRYQGITRIATPQVAEAVRSTRGEVLTSESRICDARFSKCCGGAMEEFQNCWENVRHPYLTGKRDYIPESHASDSEKQITGPAIQLPDLTQEEEADRWIRTSPDAFCNTQDKKILSQVLNNYDQETTDFYRWKISYSQQELAELIHQRSGIDFGEIIDLIPVERGTSGRLIRLKIVGTLRTLTIGKELEIRRTLSPSHLYSSAFLVDKEKGEEGNVPTRFTLTGAGWGHGVGLCQIGAAVMGERGYYYKDILAHYYPGSRLEKQYE